MVAFSTVIEAGNVVGASGVRRLGTGDQVLSEVNGCRVFSVGTGDQSFSGIFDGSEQSTESAAVSVSVKCVVAGEGLLKLF